MGWAWCVLMKRAVFSGQIVYRVFDLSQLTLTEVVGWF
jgi:hypothetical protein